MHGHILIVENENDIADVLRRYLEFEGFRIACAATCEEARVLCAARPPELIVLDWHLPDVDSNEWVEELRTHAATAGIPIIMMTGGYPTPALSAQLEVGTFLGFCLGCKLFAGLMKVGVVPESVCEACANLNLPRPTA